MWVAEGKRGLWGKVLTIDKIQFIVLFLQHILENKNTNLGKDTNLGNTE